jgi:hypothetical protein
VDQEERPGGQGEELILRLGAVRPRHLGLAVVILVVAVAVIWPARRRRVEAWVLYQVFDQVPPPLVAGLHGRLFLGNHEGNPPGSLITGVCGSSVDQAGVDRAAGLLRPLLAAARATGVPIRLLVVPTAPRLYPEDLPPPYAAECEHAVPAADRLVAALADPAVIYPASPMLAMKSQFEVVPLHHFHWAGEAPLRVAELVAADLGLPRVLDLALHDDVRRSDLDGYDRGMGAQSYIREPSLAPAGVAVCEGGRRCPAAPDPAIAMYTRPGPGRVLVVADSFGDEIGGDFTEFAGQVWLLRMNLALARPPDALADLAIRHFAPDAIVIVYHDASALALDGPSRQSLEATTSLFRAAAQDEVRRAPSLAVPTGRSRTTVNLGDSLLDLLEPEAPAAQ